MAEAEEEEWISHEVSSPFSRPFPKTVFPGESSIYVPLSRIEKNKKDLMNDLTIWHLVMTLLHIFNIVCVSLLPLDLYTRCISHIFVTSFTGFWKMITSFKAFPKIIIQSLVKLCTSKEKMLVGRGWNWADLLSCLIMCLKLIWKKKVLLCKAKYKEQCLLITQIDEWGYYISSNFLVILCWRSSSSASFYLFDFSFPLLAPDWVRAQHGHTITSSNI